MIKTANLQLIPCELKHFEAIFKDPKQFEQILGITVFDDWFNFPEVAGIEALQFSYEYLQTHPDVHRWWTYLFIHIKDNVLVGLGGYKGTANEVGMVEIGYAIVPPYQCRGLATEAAQGLVDYAFSHQPIQMVEAHTLAQRNASTRVLEKVGLKYVGTAYDPDEGDVWHWGLNREDYRSAHLSEPRINKP